MDGDAVLEVLKEIRDETKQTNVRLDGLTHEVGQTNARLDGLAGEVTQTNARLDGLTGEVTQTNVRLGGLTAEVTQTNVRLDQTNSRLEALEGRTEFLERRVTAGFDKLAEHIDGVWRGQRESETRLATEVLSLAAVTHDVKDLLLNANIHELKARVAALEDRLAGRDH
jgi:chromosome segregation ATPase